MIACVNCGVKYTEKTLYPIPTYAMELGACADCLLKYGATTLAEEAERWLAIHFSDEAKEAVQFELMRPCMHCGEKVLRRPDGTKPIMCGKCQHELDLVRNKS